MKTFLKNTFSVIKKNIETGIQILMILVFTKYRYVKNFKPKKNQKKKLIILGNGPSLKKDLSKIEAVINNDSELMCVNSFANTEYYEKLKPQHYVIIDPSFFNDTHNNNRITTLTNLLSNDLVKKTKWHMYLYIPRYYSNSSLIKKISSNKSIKIVLFNNVPLSGGFKHIKQFFFSKNLGNPIFQNVLVAAIFIGLQKNYKNIFLFGSDHSWLQNIAVLDDKSVILNDTHFNESNREQFILKNLDGSQKKLHVFLFQIATMFKEYHILNNYANSKSIKIINFTNGSYIDAFDKTNSV